MGISQTEIYVDLPPFSVLPGLKTKILKEDGVVELARNMSKLISGLYEAQFDHWRGSVYGPSNIREELSKASETVLGL